MKVLTVVGARPQFVKAAALSREFSKSADIEEVIVHTGQHFDDNMSQVFFDQMQIPAPAYNLDVNSLGHGAMTGRMLEGIEEILIREKPDVLLVFGDTNSTIAGALAAKKMHIKVAHVEAGLRSFDMRMPEEINRILTDRISNFLYCPTEAAVQNLAAEGFNDFECTILKTGDVMQDAALFYATTSARRSSIIDDLSLDGAFGLATIHRAENTDDAQKLRSIVSSLNNIHLKQRIVCPIHPRTQSILNDLNIEVQFDLIQPVGYFDMIELLKGSSIVLTDSGGLQKEAFFFSSPCLTLREQTEWVELIEGGYNLLVGSDQEKIVGGFETMMNKKMDFGADLYGKGHASQNIVNHLIGQF